MRVLYLLPALTGAGTERQIAQLSSAVRELRHEVLVGFIHQGPGARPAVPLHEFATKGAWDPRLVAEIVDLIRKWSPDIVHTSLPRMDVAGGIAAAMCGIPLVVREPNAEASYRSPLKAMMRVGVARIAGATIIANSSQGLRYWQERAPRLRRTQIRNSIDVSAIERATAVAPPDHAFIGLYVGRLEPEKNVDVFLRSCAVLMNERDLAVYICGDGSERERLVTLATELGIAPRVRFVGFTRDVFSYLAVADFAVLLSDFEGQPNAVLEAFTAGVPAILSDIPAHRELAAGGIAPLVPLHDVDATVRAVREVLDDVPRTRERVTRARESIAGSSPAAVAAQAIRVYETVSSQSSRRHPEEGQGLAVAIDASNLRSGGGITHIAELLRHTQPQHHGIDRVTIWGGAVTLAHVPARPWLHRVHVRALDGNLLRRVTWQLIERRRHARSHDVLFAPGATPPCRAPAYVSMSQNMLPFDARARKHYGMSAVRLRLFLLRYIQAHAFRRSAVVIFLTESARRYVGGSAGGGVLERSVVIPHGVSDAFRSLRRTTRPLSSYTPAEPFLFLYVSDLYRHKHHWAVAEAVCRLRREGLPVAIDIIGCEGDASAVRRLEQVLEASPGERDAVRVRGPMAHEAIAASYRDADAFVFASTCENLPIALIEAMAAGLPICSAATAPLTEVLGEGAVYFEPEDPASIACALRSVAGDLALRERIAAITSAASQKYSWDFAAHATWKAIAHAARSAQRVAPAPRSEWAPYAGDDQMSPP